MGGETIPGAAEVTPEATGRVTWWGHATATIELGEHRLLVDPLLRGRARRAGAVDTVLITHSHVDHLHRWTLKAIDRAVRLVVPKGAAPIVADLGFREVTEVEPGDAIDLGGCEVHAVPTRHDNGRWRKGDAPTCVGYVARAGATAVHHAGDVDVSDHDVFDELGKRFAITVTLLPIGGMMPVWWYRWRRATKDRGVHIDPDCALALHERLGAAAMVPIHWGTVNLRLGPPSMPARRLIKVAGERGVQTVRVLDHGGVLELAGSQVLTEPAGRARSQVIPEHPHHADDGDREPDERAEQAVAHHRA